MVRGEMGYSHITFGKRGEEIGADYMERQGYTILERNFRIRTGEIDIIAMQENCLVFVEVKTRHGLTFGLPCEAVTRQKQRKICTTAKVYCARNNMAYELYRFDVIEILVRNKTCRLRHLVDAYRC